MADKTAPNLTLNQAEVKQKKDEYEDLNTAPNLTLGVEGMKLKRPAKEVLPEPEPAPEPAKAPATPKAK